MDLTIEKQGINSFQVDHRILVASVLSPTAEYSEFNVARDGPLSECLTPGWNASSGSCTPKSQKIAIELKIIETTVFFFGDSKIFISASDSAIFLPLEGTPSWSTGATEEPQRPSHLTWAYYGLLASGAERNLSFLQIYKDKEYIVVVV